MKILITGANGYIGSKVVKALCDAGITTIATDFDDKYIDSRAIFIKATIFEKNENWYSFFNELNDTCSLLSVKY